MKCIVTGAGGFIGSHLVRYLVEQGWDVCAVDRDGAGESVRRLAELEALPRVAALRIDLTDRRQLERLPRADGVFHLAAINGTANFYARPFETLIHSTVPTVQLLDHFSASNLSFFFYAGSSEAYSSTVTRFGWAVPTTEDVPLSVSHPSETRWSYGASKLHGEVACFAAAAQYGVPISIGRLHNPYGPDMGVDHVIPDFILRAGAGRFALYGATQTRSFIYIDDAVRSIVAVAQGALGQVVNIGSSDEITMEDLARTIMTVAGWRGDIEVHPSPPGSVARRSPETSRLKGLISMEDFVPLPEGLRRTVAAYLG